MIVKVLATTAKLMCGIGARGITNNVIDTLARPETMTGIYKTCYGAGKWALGSAAVYTVYDTIDRKERSVRKAKTWVESQAYSEKEIELAELKKKLQEMEKEEKETK